MRESTIERSARDYARARGVLCLKFTSPGVAGVPDRLLIGPSGLVAFVEFKAPGKKPTALQRHWLTKLSDHNVRAEWVDNLTDAKRIIDSL